MIFTAFHSHAQLHSSTSYQKQALAMKVSTESGNIKCQSLIKRKKHGREGKIKAEAKNISSHNKNLS